MDVIVIEGRDEIGGGALKWVERKGTWWAVGEIECEKSGELKRESTTVFLSCALRHSTCLHSVQCTSVAFVSHGAHMLLPLCYLHHTFRFFRPRLITARRTPIGPSSPLWSNDSRRP